MHPLSQLLSAARSASIGLFFAVLASCQVNPYFLSNTRDGDGGSDPSKNRDGGGAPTGDGGHQEDGGLFVPDASTCVAKLEICDGRDNDCDESIDEDFNLQVDPGNCGSCGNRCSLANSQGVCNSGQCEFSCSTGFYDLNGDLASASSDGCEYACLPLNPGPEVCDIVPEDNDCDGMIDEGVNVLTDVANCGACGTQCVAIHATAECTAGVCGFSACDAGFGDLLPGIAGCEYQCPVFPTVAEVCNNIDDDCDGSIDNLPLAGLGGACTDPGFTAQADIGECAFGVEICSLGSVVCDGYVGPSQDICDEIDNNCNGQIDEGFDKQNDARNCGSCNPCNLPNSIEGCSGGVCNVFQCDAGFVDLDGIASNGCELACTPSGPEVCDGIDNDCDSLVDAADPDLVVPTNFCTGQGPCVGTSPTCTSTSCDAAVTWRCVYGGNSEADTCGVLPVQETLCDNVDGDCDGSVDETFGAKVACDDGGIGACKGTGVMACNSAQDGLVCVISSPGQTATVSEMFCDNVDEDCNGQIDDGAPNTMVNVVNGATSFWIDTYEASRPDATASLGGLAGHRSCSNANVIPWRNVSWVDANAACVAAGYRLCTEAEWELACGGSLAKSYPYGNVYDATACNGNDYDPDCTLPDDDICLPTGSAYGCPAPAQSACISDYSALDMSGNLKEWTASQITAVPPTYRIRGGAYDTVDSGLTCQFKFLSASQDFYFSNLGFRCCSNTAP